jgi:hypothetical protein
MQCAVASDFGSGRHQHGWTGAIDKLEKLFA